jgi:hypothetical protein
VVNDARLHDDLQRRAGELHRSLEDIGFGDSRVVVRGTEAVASAPSAGDAKSRSQDEGRESSRGNADADREGRAPRRDRDRGQEQSPRHRAWQEELTQ